MSSLYSTIDYTKSVMAATSVGSTQTTLDNARLRNNLRTVSRRLDSKLGAQSPLFVPIIETVDIPVTPDRINSALNTFEVRHPRGGYLLAMTVVTIGTATLTVGTDVVGYPSTSVPPFKYLRLRTGNSWYGYCSSNALDPLTLTITGIWGIHRDYLHAWVKVDDITNVGGITDSATSMTVADVDGVDQYGATPRISTGNVLRVGTEYMDVSATDTATNTITLIRGVNGSTAASHNQGDDVDVWQVEESVRHVVARQSGLMYARAGAYVTVEIQALGGEIRFPADLLQEVYGVLQDMQYA
jgi:hypothetical protein